jgi:iron(III) transport system ATP-binding protein
MIELRNVSKTVTSGSEPLTILHPLTLQIPHGQFVAIVGPSGSGKSTLLGLIAGLDAPSSGSVLIDTVDITRLDEDALAKLRGEKIGFVFQFFHLIPSLTAYENVAVPMEIAGVSDVRSRTERLLEEVGLTGRSHHYPSQLSGGEQQRVALARAIAPRPSVLLMDEPFSGLDPRLRDRMREETLAILHETRATCIVVTHDAEEAMRMGDNVVLLRNGRVVQAGSALDLYRAPKNILAACTFSDLNEVPARIENGMAKTALGDFRANGLANGKDAIACVRHSGVRLLPAGEGIPARVIDHRFLGDVALVEMAVPGLDTPLFARVREGDAPPVGSEIGVRVDAGGVLVFEATGNNNGMNGAN